MSSVRIGGDVVGGGEPTWVIAEIGINHNGSMDLAKAMIDAACDVGCDAVKFQKRTVEAVYSEAELIKPRKSPFGETNGDLKRGLEFDTRQMSKLGRYALDKGMAWGASVWDEFSVADLALKCTTRPSFIKIASPTLTNLNVLKACAPLMHIDRIPVILSTGMSSMDEVRKAVEILGTERLVLMHCVSDYPAQKRHLNLNNIHTLGAEFGVPVGYSGHEDGNDASIYAATLGACCIERHFTLSKSLWGSDQKVSLEPSDMRDMAIRLKLLSLMGGSYDVECLPCEEKAKSKLRK